MEVDQRLLLLVESDSIGDSEIDLGHELMHAFLGQLAEVETIPAEAIFMGTGIMLTTARSPVAAELKTLAERGCRISSCGTCLDYYDRAEALVVGRRGNMKETVAALTRYDKVLRI
jgi:selenium metabolism protein YedF